jgi:adenylate cyclase class IV
MWQNPARNIEIKARINDVKAIVNKVAQLCKTEAEVIDTFFKTENGRLKLREFKVSNIYLI